MNNIIVDLTKQAESECTCTTDVPKGKHKLECPYLGKQLGIVKNLIDL